MKRLILLASLIGVSAIPSLLYLIDSVRSIPPETVVAPHFPRKVEAVQTGDYEPVDDSIKIELVVRKLKSMTKEDHVVGQDNSVYVLVSEEVFAKLPKMINGLIIKRYSGSVISYEGDISYLAFSRWAKKNGSVWVTIVAYFAGGNTSGCHYEYIYIPSEGSWKRGLSECFAGAS